MALPLRIEYPGAWYHVMNRTVNRNQRFSESDDYELFIKALKEACDLFYVYIPLIVL
ncbi:transposase and inactivated derivatives [Candidatus Scalindua japonica]|uniref:Transposase and inactivated derivatives n=1 Tax=Candidatus Scalindua japonica TaxID=1284222 RepID=A0A286TXQ9_9BACT|nr:transposase and inactivated derivatives [Candidatus Scalindua japonica]